MAVRFQIDDAVVPQERNQDAEQRHGCCQDQPGDDAAPVRAVGGSGPRESRWVRNGVAHALMTHELSGHYMVPKQGFEP